jgi:excinuclease ABC subunit B
MKFQIKSSYKMSEGQAEVVEKLYAKYPTSSKQTLLGITGSGKTFVMANMIQKIQKPTLIVAHNKTLAAQLYTELKELFPNNRVEFFISYYDYYQPESYLPSSDTYIEKEATVNEQIEKFRLHAVSSLMSREDVIVVASISCIYGLGNPDDFKTMSTTIANNTQITRSEFIRRLIAMQYERNDKSLESGKFRVRGDTIDLIPAYEDNIIRVEFEGNTVAKISELNSVTLDKINDIDKITIFPARQYVVPEEKQKKAIDSIKEELESEVLNLGPLEAERLRKRVKYDIEMIEEVGYCNGIENYSMHFDGRPSGKPPFVLLDYFPSDFFLIIDESHQTIPQSRAMYNGDYARKKNLVDYGFRLPSAFDNRPLKFEEFEKYFRHTMFVSATPGPYEIQTSSQVAELIVRPTGLLDPVLEVKPIKNQVQDLLSEIANVTARNERVLITTLTKRMAEDLTDHLAQENIRVRYLHSEIQNLERIELIRQLRAGNFDVLVGINLLREGLDIPEVSLICILDADKEGFLRDERSLIQTIGRAARNVNGRVILYADVMTKSIQATLEITNRRRRAQIEYNKKHNITPQTIIKLIAEKKKEIKSHKHLSKTDIEKKLIQLDADMRKYAEQLEFEKAIQLRDELESLQAEYAAIRSEKEYKANITEHKNKKNKKKE